MIINNHNMSILDKNREIKGGCDCRNETNCSLSGRCLSPNIVYEWKITSSQPNFTEKVYYGVAEKSFKDVQNRTITPNSSFTKITQTTQNCWKNIEKLIVGSYLVTTKSSVMFFNGFITLG